MDKNVSYFGQTDHRASCIRFGIRQPDRLSHIYAIGKTGVGKSTLLQILARGDLEARRGFAFIDPHGDAAEIVMNDAKRLGLSVTYLDAGDPAQPYGYNPLRRVREDKIPLAVSGLIETFRKLWPDAWGVRLEHVLRNSLYALFEQEVATLPDILRLYANESYRKSVVRKLKNKVVRSFWTSEFEKYHYRQKADAIAPVQNKLGAMLSDPTLFKILVTPNIDLHFRSMMDRGEVLIVNLAKGMLGEESSSLLGSFVVSTLGLAAFSRIDQGTEKRKPYAIFIDEFQSFTTLMIISMMAELRKTGVSLVLANQHFHQVDPDIRSAVIGNVGTLISFRVGAEDASFLAREFEPVFGREDFVNLPNQAFYLRLMVDGAPSRPFSGKLIPLHI